MVINVSGHIYYQAIYTKSCQLFNIFKDKSSARFSFVKVFDVLFGGGGILILRQRNLSKQISVSHYKDLFTLCAVKRFKACNIKIGPCRTFILSYICNASSPIGVNS